jgi:hypothetical protein
MKNLIYTLSIILAATLTASAQKADTVKRHRWNNRMEMHDMPAGAVQVQVTYRQYDMGQLNNSLNSAGIPSLSNNDIWINLSMSHIHNKWISEDGIGFTPLSTSNANNIKTRFNQYQLYFRQAYNLSNSSTYRAYPFIGANFSMAVLNIEDYAREQNVTNFSQALLNSTSSKTFYQPNFGIEFGGGFDYVIKLKPKSMDCITVQRNIPIGIRAGYYLNTYASRWKIDDYGYNNSPNNKQSAVFVSLNIGLGYEVNKR